MPREDCQSSMKTVKHTAAAQKKNGTHHFPAGKWTMRTWKALISSISSTDLQEYILWCVWHSEESTFSGFPIDKMRFLSHQRHQLLWLGFFSARQLIWGICIQQLPILSPQVSNWSLAGTPWNIWGVLKWWYSKMDGVKWKILLKMDDLGFFSYFRKPP